MKANKVSATRTVYCYYFPEIRRLISRLGTHFPHQVFLRSITPGLDDFHEPLITAYMKMVKPQLPHLASYPYHYITAGASEGIFHVLAEIAARKKRPRLYVFEGEYEGYEAYGNNLELKFKQVDWGTDPKQLSPGIFFISNPSARNGNIIPNSVIKAIGDAGHEIILDVTYVGLTAPHRFLDNHKAISTVIVSLSKPYGLYYYRLGFCFSRQRRETLSANKWFKNIFSIIVGQKIIAKYPYPYLFNKYRTKQKKALACLKEETGLEVHASDVLLLGYLPKNEATKPAALVTYRRGQTFRFCLTPYFLKLEK